ncbi:unnamed protein product [Victoria cruziana]
MSGACRSNSIRHIVRIRQMLQRWRKQAATRRTRGVPPDVPAGHLAVYVGRSRRRFVVRASYLNYPAFRMLLSKAEEEYGYDYAGPIVIPCDELLFEEILRLVAGNENGGKSSSSELPASRQRPSIAPPGDELQRRCCDAKLWADSTPLLNAVAGQSIG